MVEIVSKLKKLLELEMFPELPVVMMHTFRILQQNITRQARVNQLRS